MGIPLPAPRPTTPTTTICLLAHSTTTAVPRARATIQEQQGHLRKKRTRTRAWSDVNADDAAAQVAQRRVAKKDTAYRRLNEVRSELRTRGLDTVGRAPELEQRLLRAHV